MADRTSPTGRNLPAFHCQLLIALVLLCSVMGCRGNHNAAAEQEEAADLQQIKDNGELVVLHPILFTAARTWDSNMNWVNSLPKASASS